MSDTPDPLPGPGDPRSLRRGQGRVVFAAVIGGGAALVAAIAGLVILGSTNNQDTQIASTGLASIGSTLAGGFAGWLARTHPQPDNTRRRASDGGGEDRRT